MQRSVQALPTHDEATPARQGYGCLVVRLTVALLLALGTIGLLSTPVVLEAVFGPYEDRIYPNVYVSGVDLSGLTTDEAAECLAETFSDYDAGTCNLTDGERLWEVPWTEAGLRFDVDTTVERAFAAGREGQGLGTLLSMWTERHEIAPAFAIDSEAARGVLERLAPEVSVPPTDAMLRIEGDQVVAVPGQPGWVLDVEATLENMVTTVTHLGPDNQFALTFHTVPPHVVDVEQVQSQAEEMLNCQVYVSTYDVLTDEVFAWTLGRDAVVTWLRVGQNDDGPTITVSEEAVRATLAGLDAELGEERGFDLEGATERVLRVFEAGGGLVELKMVHQPRPYVVQPGDSITTIAARFGMPPGLIAEANPGIDFNQLQVGQELMIPAEDVLRPYPVVPGKRIVISIAEQGMRVYEDDELLWEWPVSTGIARSPTYTGEFQILSKEENAYASQWDLWMPHFMAVYRAGGDTYNGIHGLPVRNGQQLRWALGSPASYGCIVLGIEEAETLYNWAEIGVLVIIE